MRIRVSSRERSLGSAANGVDTSSPVLLFCNCQNETQIELGRNHAGSDLLLSFPNPDDGDDNRDGLSDQHLGRVSLTLEKATGKKAVDPVIHDEKPLQDPSGATPLMTRTRMKADVDDANEHRVNAVSRRVQEARDLIKEWSASQNRPLTENETECLVSAVLDGEDNVDLFNCILFGVSFRSEHNSLECRNIFHSTQELVNGVMASQEDFLLKSSEILEGVQNAAAQLLTMVAPPSAGSVLSAPKVSGSGIRSQPTEKNVDILSPSPAPKDPAAVNTMIKQKAPKGEGESSGSADQAKALAEEFCTAIGGSLSFISKAFKVDDPILFVLEFMVEAKMTPVEAKNSREVTLAKLVDYAKSGKAQKSKEGQSIYSHASNY